MFLIFLWQKTKKECDLYDTFKSKYIKEVRKYNIMYYLTLFGLNSIQLFIFMRFSQ